MHVKAEYFENIKFVFLFLCFSLSFSFMYVLSQALPGVILCFLGRRDNKLLFNKRLHSKL